VSLLKQGQTKTVDIQLTFDGQVLSEQSLCTSNNASIHNLQQLTNKVISLTVIFSQELTALLIIMGDWCIVSLWRNALPNVCQSLTEPFFIYWLTAMCGKAHWSLCHGHCSQNMCIRTSLWVTFQHRNEMALTENIIVE